MPDSLTILHVSDLHISGRGGYGAGQRMLFNRFWEYVERWASSLQEQNPDLIVVTGDLARKGLIEQYGLTKRFQRSRSTHTVWGFLTRLCEAFELPSTCLLFTPGNHDVDRQLVSRDFARIELEQAASFQSFSEFFYDTSKEGLREQVVSRLRPFYEFSVRFRGTKSRNKTGAILEHLYEPRLLGVSDGLPVRVSAVPICTPLLSQSYYSATHDNPPITNMESEPEGCLAVCQPKIEEAIEEAGVLTTRALRVAFMHHPISWLADWEREPLRNYLGRKFHLVLTGHIHKGRIFTPSLDHTGFFISAGALYAGRGYRNSFNVLHIDFVDSEPSFGHLRTVEWNPDASLWENHTVKMDITDLYKSIGYSYVDGWLRFPFLQASSPEPGSPGVVLHCRMPGRRPEEITPDELEQLLNAIRAATNNPKVEIVVMKMESTVLEMGISAVKAPTICGLLSEPQSDLSQLLFKHGITEACVGNRKFFLQPNHSYVSGEYEVRLPTLSSAELDAAFDMGTGSLWQATSPALEEMFRVRGICDLLLPINPKAESSAFYENISAPQESRSDKDVVEDWSWYCTSRDKTDPNNSPEAMLHKYLQHSVENGTKKVILIHGGTGHGKTTFVRYFFRKYLPESDRDLANRTIAVRLSMGIAGMTVESIEDDVDHKMCAILDALHPEFYDDEHMIAMANLVRSVPSSFHRALINKYPMGQSHNSKLRWIQELIGRKSVDPVANNAFADFNRLRLQYLTRKFGKKIVIVFDNIDQMPRNIQEATFMLARHKLEWVQDTNDVIIIVAIRSYMLARAAKELPLAAYQTRYEIAVRPCPMQNVLERRLRFVSPKLPLSVKFTDPELFGRSGIPTTVQRKTILGLLKRLIQVFGETETALALSRMTYGDMREQLRMVRETLRSPNIEWLQLAHLVSNRSRFILSSDKLLDVLLRGTNSLCSTVSPVFFQNMFDAGQKPHFCNSLNRMYILRMLRSLRSAQVTELVATMAELGHPPYCTQDSIATMLAHNIITSPEGQYLKEDDVRQVLFDSRGSQLGTLYCDVLPYRLYYLQAMAYQTPLVARFRKEVPLPHKTRDRMYHITSRVKAAAVLVRQIKSDEAAQDDCINDNRQAKDVFDRFQLHGIGEKMCMEAHNQLGRLVETGGYKAAVFDQLKSLF